MGRLFASLIIILGISMASTLVFSAEGAPAKKVLLISDIDDTIKLSLVLSHIGMVNRATDITSPFRGMAQLYQWIINMNPQSTKLVYLSNAPEEIAGIPAIRFSHEMFLAYNKFPEGEMILREDLNNADHKIQAIRRLIDQEKPEVVILVGDNGERDSEVYHQVVTEFKDAGIQFVSFIHQLYSTKVPDYLPTALAFIGKPIFTEQIGFVTPIEIALELRDQSLLNSEAVQWMVNNVSPFIVRERAFVSIGFRPMTFPNFSNCSDFVWRWKKTPDLMPLIQKLENKCN